MKRCPECRRDYYDDSLLYCLDDGSTLLEGPGSGSESQTAILHETAPPGEAVTKPQIHTTEQTAVLPTGVTELQKGKGFNKRLLFVPLGIAIIILGGFLGYRYVTQAKQINSIAVMPFVNESGNADLEYLSDGVTESLINNLSQLTNLSVKGRSSVFQYKSKEISPQQVASELKVQAVLNGRVTQRGDSLSISLDLVDGTTGDQIWGEQYIRPAGDLAALQSDIARDVSQKLRTRLSGADESRVVKNQTQNTEAYQLYLKGRYNWNKRTDAAMKKAIEYFLQATEKDPNYAMAFVGLAESYLLSPLSTDELKATVAARRAIEIDPLLGEPHATLAVVLKDSHDFKGAENEFRRAIELAPNYPTSYHWLGEMLTQDARFEEGFAEYQKALELDPLSLAIATDYGQALYNDKQYDHAVEYLKGLLEIDPSYVRTHSYLAQVYRAMGRYEDAIDEDHRAAILLGTDPEEAGEVKRQLTQALRAGGAKGYWTKKLELAQQDLQKGRVVAATDMAAIYAQTGNRDEAFQWLEKALQAHEGDVPTLKVGPEWQNLRGDPRLSDLIRRAGLSAPNGS